MYRFRFLIAVSAYLAVVSAGRAQSYAYEWDYLGTTYSDGALINVPNAGTFTIGVYIREAGGTSLSTPGMSSAGVWVYSSDGITGAFVANPGDITGNVTGSGFTNTGLYVRDTADPGVAILTMARNVGTGATGSGPNGRIWLGDFLYTAGQNETTLTASNPTDNDYNFILGAAGAVFPTSATLTLNPVPEPATILGLSALTALGVRFVRRRRVHV